MSTRANYKSGAARGNKISVKPSKSDIKRDKRDLDNLGRYLGLTDADFDDETRRYPVTLPKFKSLSK